ncbi:bile acid:sodium symporter [Echinicola soli]|uniref:Bile acid:sodium symporter n=1 Tax=Echinicola soli TaxID=2591634 RepID=A0A514CJC1_9BACT|nr:bile acid:sodium symporter family protein [Echinicola soli]QDH79866.1 bile acid:sodium symporter [Echinicola soli]
MNSVLGRLRKVGLNGFFMTLILVILLAYLSPAIGADHSGMPWNELIIIGNALIFFFYGIKLDPHQLKVAVGNWRLHTVVQLTTFLVFPILVWLLFVFAGKPGGEIGLGVMFLAALPSTVSSSVVMVNIARGNVPAAIFNASFSSLLGIFITPLWMNLFMDNGGSGVLFDFMPTITKLSIQILLPFILGLLLHAKLKKWAGKFAEPLKRFDQGVILMIVFTSFANAFFDHMFEGMSNSYLGMLGVSMATLFVLVVLVMNLLASKWDMPMQDRITLIFCGSKKSLVHGAIIGSVLFPDPAVLGAVLLPVMVYHALQLLMGSALAGYFQERGGYTQKGIN